MKLKLLLQVLALLAVSLWSCEDDDSMPPTDMPLDPETAPKASIDRFAPGTGTLFVRDGSNGLPAENEAVDFDVAPFITQGLGTDGEVVEYYNFDVQPDVPAPIYLFFDESGNRLEEQLNIVDVIPGDAGYNDFWQVFQVTVPDDYVMNSITSLTELTASGFDIEETATVVNCPIVPDGSTATKRFGPEESMELNEGWYQDMVIYYFNFFEKVLTLTPDDKVPVSDILVTFNINPDMDGGGPPSGFVTEGATAQTRNAVETLPEDAAYSALWNVSAYDNADFKMVYDFASASSANVIAADIALVNCPVVSSSEGNLPMDPESADKTSIDRFGESFATLFVRDGSNGLPMPNEPVDFDMGPFITKGLGPNGEKVEYYNFDVLPLKPAPIYLFFYEDGSAVEGQINIVDVVPGDEGYNDFWQVVRVTAPDYYIANTITSLDELEGSGFTIEETTTVVNCPIVPDGSTASKRFGAGESTGLNMGWYKDEVIYYFNFFEKILTAEMVDDMLNTPTSDIYVTFNINPGMDGGGPPSGFMTEMGQDQTHNVVETLPTDDAYSPLWDVNIYDNADFGNVSNLMTAMNAQILAMDAAIVNCPIVSVE